MLRFDLKAKVFTSLEKHTMQEQSIMERYDFQAAAVHSWESFRPYIGLETSYLIGQEIRPHKSVGDSIDLLAFRPDDSTLTVIELKRGKKKLQLLQALSYAAMVSTWDKERLIHSIQRNINPDPEELIDLINDNPLNEEIGIILVSEFYDPEVILTANWLQTQYNVNISAFSVDVHIMGGETIIDIDQRLPLKELQDIYDSRGRKRGRTRVSSDVTWEDVLPKLEYPFAERALRLCRNEKEGDPARRRFVSFRSNMHGYTWIIVNFNYKYLNIYMKGKPSNAEDEIRKVFGEDTAISTWREGHSFKVETGAQFEALVSWLKMKDVPTE